MEEHRRQFGATDKTVLTSICFELGRDQALTRTGRNRTANHPRGNFMATEPLHSQGEMGRDGYPRLN